MESHEQGFLFAYDSHVSYDTDICSIQSEVQRQLECSERHVVPEPDLLEAPVLQVSGVNVGEQQAEVDSRFTHEDSSAVLENGKGPDSSNSEFDKRCVVSSDDSGHFKVSTADGTIKAGMCIGTIVSEPHHTTKPETFRSPKVQETASTSKIKNRIDYGESIAMADFGGEFEDGHGIEEFPFPSVSIFSDGDANKPEAVNSAVRMDVNDDNDEVRAEAQNDLVDTGPKEQPDVPEILDKIVPKSPAGEVPADEEPPILERELTSKAGDLEQTDEGDDDKESEMSSSKAPSRWSRRLSGVVAKRTQPPETTHMPASNLELNVHSRPRRSVNRKSVFELLHVEYRPAGAPKKGATRHESEVEASHESPPKKRKSLKKGGKVSSGHLGHSAETPVTARHLLSSSHDKLCDIDDRIDALRKKVVSYRPDDFLDDGDLETEPKAGRNVKGSGKKPSLDADESSLKESMFAEADDRAARSFLSTFAAASDEALSSSKHTEDASGELDALIAENQQLRSRIKTLEQSKSVTKKFNIDFHGRKFHRIRSPAFASPEQQKTPGKIVGGSYDVGTPATEQKTATETNESVLSRTAVLDRREHKLRELSAELDERATAVKIAEGALRRRECKLQDFEKTLKHRERVLSRHEQSVLKRELIVGSSYVPAADSPAEENADRQSFAAEMQQRLDQRRLELDRRQATIDSERNRLETREKELDHREATSRMTGDSKTIVDGGPYSKASVTVRRGKQPTKHLTSAGNRKTKTSVSHSIRSKYLSTTKQKVCFGLD